MKHHIAIKFLAVLLATLSLLCVIGSAAAIIGFTAADLYEHSVDELIDQNMQATRQDLAMHLVHEYASLKLGNVPQEYFYDYWGLNWMYTNFQYGCYFYTIRDEHGAIVESTAEDLPEGTSKYVHVVTDVSFRHTLQVTPENAMAETDTGMDAYADATVPSTVDPAESSVPASVSEESLRAYGRLSREDIHTATYYDSEQGGWMEISYFFDKLPPYTVELYLLPGAVVVEPVWNLIAQIWQYRYQLFYVLGISILVFSICAVYLCCAAGRKPGTDAVRPAGFNCVPLDLYAAAGGLGICLILFFGMEAAEYLVRYSPNVLLPFIVVAGCGCCLIFVGFCFACAAQFKTPGGYWWHNSLIGYCLRGLLRLLRWMLNAFISGCKWSGPVLKTCMYTLWGWTAALFRWAISACKFLWRLFISTLQTLWKWIQRFTDWCFRLLQRFIALLPLTWQWLLGGFVLILLSAFCINQYNHAWQWFGWICTLGIILYGAHAFGILLASTKRMSHGDLESKVSDQFLIGSFQEFAGDLNALADVAVVAAQKQLKSERMKTELITNVSHDIKTPLTSIINYVDLLQKPHTPEEQEAYLEVLNRQSLRLKKLIDDLMEMSKASTGNMPVEITSVNATEAINQALGEFSDKLDKAQLIPVFHQSEEAVYMKADGRLLWRILSNLLGNAVKYALPGTRVYLDLMQLEGKVILSIKNISREQLNINAEELMERFVRGDSSRNTEGSGLGLNIAKSLAELQHGQMHLMVDGDLFKVTLIFPMA